MDGNLISCISPSNGKVSPGDARHGGYHQLRLRWHHCGSLVGKCVGNGESQVQRPKCVLPKKGFIIFVRVQFQMM